MKLKVDVEYKILKPINEVYDAIVNPVKLSGYFTTRSNKGIENIERIKWYFDDVGVELEIDIKKIERNQQISFEWDASGTNALVNIILKAENKEVTFIRITEEEWSVDEKGIKSVLSQTQGWTDFICSLKAYLYTGINLRNGRTKE